MQYMYPVDGRVCLSPALVPAGGARGSVHAHGVGRALGRVCNATARTRNRRTRVRARGGTRGGTRGEWAVMAVCDNDGGA
eukprot:COSAG02_NODE_33656_length_496_cov_3.919395_1_plen_79_part_10